MPDLKKMLNTRLLLLFALLIISPMVMAQRDSVMYGIASYYHTKFNGRKTSNGEIFRNDSLTAAHKNLPFGTWVKVTNLKNDSSVIVRINDRLPQSSKRSIDLSQAAAKKLNMMKAGIVKARIDILPPINTVQLADTVLIDVPEDTSAAFTDTAGQLQFEPVPVLRDTVITHPAVMDNGNTHITFDVIRNGMLNVYQVTREPNAKTIYRKNGTIISKKEFQAATGSPL